MAALVTPALPAGIVMVLVLSAPSQERVLAAFRRKEPRRIRGDGRRRTAMGLVVCLSSWPFLVARVRLPIDWSATLSGKCRETTRTTMYLTEL